MVLLLTPGHPRVPPRIKAQPGFDAPAGMGVHLALSGGPGSSLLAVSLGDAAPCPTSPTCPPPGTSTAALVRGPAMSGPHTPLT